MFSFHGLGNHGLSIGARLPPRARARESATQTPSHTGATHTALWTIGLVLIVATVALPSLASIALTGCLLLAGVQGALALATELRRRPRPSNTVLLTPGRR